MRPGSSWGYLLDLGPEQGSQRKKKRWTGGAQGSLGAPADPSCPEPWAHTSFRTDFSELLTNIMGSLLPSFSLLMA